MKRIDLLLVALMISSTISADSFAQEPEGKVHKAFIRRGEVIHLQDGPVPLDISRCFEDCPKVVRLERVWSGGENNHLEDYLDQRFKGSKIVAMMIEGTYLELVVINGSLAPFILDHHKGELWQIHGLDAAFKTERHIATSNQVVRISPQRATDLHMDWVLDLSDPKQGLKIAHSRFSTW